MDKKAEDVLVLMLGNLTIIADYFVICSGDSPIHTRAISDWIEESLARLGIKPLRIEGQSYAHWILLDYGSVVVHVFEKETRAYYELEKLWIDADRVDIQKG